MTSMFCSRDQRWLSVAILCVLARLDSSFAYYSRNYGNSDNTGSRLTKVEEKLNILNNEVNRLTEVIQESIDSEASPLDPATLVAVHRAPGPDGNIFTIHLIKNIEELFYKISKDGQEIVPDIAVESPDGTSTLSFTCSGLCAREGKVDVLFTNKSQSSTLRLELDNHGTQALALDRFTIPTLEVKHSGDLVYDPGWNFTVRIAASYGEEKGFSRVSSSLTVVDPESEKLVSRTGYNWIEQTASKRYLETEELTLLIMTAAHPVSGFLNVSLTFGDSDVPLVKTLTVERSAILRPRNQDGPFQGDFLQFETGNYVVINNEIFQLCQIGSTCLIECAAIGPSITSMQVNSKLGEDVWEPVNNTSEFIFDYSRAIDWTIEPTADMEDLKFKCVVHSSTKNLFLRVGIILTSQEFYIDTNRSSVVVETDETYPGWPSQTARVTCTVVGRPVTDVYLLAMFQYGPEYLASDEQSGSGLGEKVVTATLDLDPSLRRGEELRGVECRAQGVYMSDSYFIEWHPSPTANTSPTTINTK